MKTKITIIIIFLSIVTYSFHPQRAIICKESKYTVIQIDSTNDWHIIYANKNDSIFKIISKKNKMDDCNEISIGKSYDFILHSRRENPPKIGNIIILPQNNLDVNCFSFDDDTYICVEPDNGIYDLYFCENLTGLCIIY
jgi:hypothetical protein